jgi:hypothetical protein
MGILRLLRLCFVEVVWVSQLTSGLKEGKDIDMSEHVILFHGDLLTKERLDSVRDSQRIKKTPRQQFQQVIPLFGLSHLDMVCVNALANAFSGKKDPHGPK